MLITPTVLRKMTALGVHLAILRWMHSFLINRQQVKNSDYLSNWTTLSGSMPQGMWLRVYFFLILINDLDATLPMFKFIDDVTMIEIIDQQEVGDMQLAINQVEEWSHANFMNISVSQTKDMIMGSAIKMPPTLVFVQNCNRMSHFLQTPRSHNYEQSKLGRSCR